MVVTIAPILNPHPLHLKYTELCGIFNELPALNLCGTIHDFGEGG